MQKFKKYIVPKMWRNGVTTNFLLLNESETEISDDPATEPAMAPDRDQEPEEEVSVWGNLW